MVTQKNDTNSDKIVIGLIGRIGSGKETFVSILRTLIIPHKLTHISTSGHLRKTLDMWGIENSRKNLQDLAIAMDTTYGLGSLTRALKSQINNANTKIVIYDSVRWQSDFDLVNEYPKHIFIYLDVSQEIRWKRSKERKEKAGEGSVSLEEFKASEMKQTETVLEKFIAHADITISNNETLEKLQQQIATFAGTHVLPKLN